MAEMVDGVLVYVGSDILTICTSTKTRNMQKADVEHRLAGIFCALYREGCRAYWVVQGPGSFLHIRVGALLLNALGSLAQDTLIYYTIRKVDLYQWMYDQERIGSSILLSIGQRKNARSYDAKTRQTRTVRFDCVQDHEYDVYDYMDRSKDDPKRIEPQRKNAPVMVHNGRIIEISKAPWEVSDQIIPYYGMDPVM